MKIQIFILSCWFSIWAMGQDDGSKPFMDSHVKRWMEKLNKQNPEEYMRLNRLREENPRGFRQALQQRVHRENIRKRFEKNPKFIKALDDFPAEHRKTLFRSLAEGRKKRNSEKSFSNPKIKQLDKEVQQLSQTYQTVKDKLAREGIKKEIAQRLNQKFDFQQQERERQIKRIEKELEKLRRIISATKKNQQERIQKQLQRLLMESKVPRKDIPQAKEIN